MKSTLFPCPCCGHLVFSKAAGSEEICPVCHWQDEVFGLIEPFSALGPNKVSLFQAQKNFVELGMSDAPSRFPVDPQWRAIGADDRFDPTDFAPERGSAYYWRPDYWLTGRD